MPDFHELPRGGASPSPRPSRAPLWRRLGLLLLVASLSLVAATLWLLRDPTDRILAARSRLVSWTETPAELVDGHWVHGVQLTAESGLVVDLSVKRPMLGPADTIPSLGLEPRPVVVMLVGERTGSRAVDLIEDTHGMVMAAVSYPYRGRERLKGIGALREIPAIRRAFFDTPGAAMLALDYLLSRPYVDTTRVEAVGVSLGAPFVTITGALDDRITRVWAIHGSGGSYEPLELNMRRKLKSRPLSALLAGIANVIIAGPRLAPERWVERIAPRPFIMVNAEDDERMPLEAVHRLYETAREPKELHWMPGQHVRSSPDVARQVLDVVRQRMERDPEGLPVAAGRRNETLTEPLRAD